MGRTRDHLGTKEAAEFLGFHPETIREWTNKGLIPHRRTPAGTRLFRLEDLKAVKAAIEAQPDANGDAA